MRALTLAIVSLTLLCSCNDRDERAAPASFNASAQASAEPCGVDPVVAEPTPAPPEPVGQCTIPGLAR